MWEISLDWTTSGWLKYFLTKYEFSAEYLTNIQKIWCGGNLTIYKNFLFCCFYGLFLLFFFIVSVVEKLFTDMIYPYIWLSLEKFKWLLYLLLDKLNLNNLKMQKMLFKKAMLLRKSYSEECLVWGKKILRFNKIYANIKDGACLWKGDVKCF